MKLADYLSREHLNPTAFAERLGMPPSTITRLLKGARSPGLNVMRKIAEETGNEVSTIEDFDVSAAARKNEDTSSGAAA